MVNRKDINFPIDENPNRTYVESSSDQGSPSPRDLLQPSSPTDTGNLGVETRTVFQKGIDGQRTVPLTGNLAYADTPDCTVFIGKKQWMDDTWTYVTNTPIERAGKVKDVLIRQRFANIITRKIDWMTEHEVFTKVKSAIDASRAFDEELRQSIEDSNLEKILTEELPADIKFNSPTSLGGSQLTKYYTESVLPEPEAIRAKFISVDTTKQNQAISYLLCRPKPSGDVSVRQNTIVAFKKGAKILCDTSSKMNNVDYFIQKKHKESVEIEGEFFKVFLFASEGDLPVKRHVEPPKQVNINDIAGDLIKRGYEETKTSKGKRVFVGYISKYHPVGNTNRPVVEVKESFKIEPPDINYSGMFNGMIELANVSSVNTSISLNGEGNATITIENPGNIFQISENDIDIVLGESPFLELSEEGFNKEKRETGHYYYRGRYYTKRAYNLVTRGEGLLKKLFDQTKFNRITASDIIKINKRIEVLEKEKNALLPLASNEAIQLKIEQIEKAQISLMKQRDELINLTEENQGEPVNTDLPKLPSSFEKVQGLTPELRLQRDVLKKYFQGKHIFEPMDRVYIWFSSPSTTVHIIPGTNTDKITSEVENPKEIERIKSKYKNNKENINDGLHETQMQCFQGLIKSINATWTGDKYILTLQCIDNSYFLSMSRYMNKPALSVTGGTNYIGAVDDPIYRLPPRKDREPKQHGETNTQNDSLVGRWKSGLFVVSGQLHSEEDEANIEKNNARKSGSNSQNTVSAKGETLETYRAQIAQAPAILSNIFGKLDSANIISILVAAIPYNPALYFQQALSVNGGVRVEENIKNKENGQPKAGEKSISGPTEDIRRTLAGQNERLGNFIPTTEITRTKVSTAELIIGIANQALAVSDNIRFFYNVYLQEIRKETKEKTLSKDFAKLQTAVFKINAQGEQEPKNTGIGLKSADIIIQNFENMFTDRSSNRGSKIPKDFDINTLPDSIITPQELQDSPASEGFTRGLRLSGNIGDQIGTFFTTMVEAAMNQFPYTDFNAVVGKQDRTGIYLIKPGKESLAYQEIINSSKALLDSIILAKSFMSQVKQTQITDEDGNPINIDGFSREISKEQLIPSREKIITKTKMNYFAVSDEYNFNTNIQAYQAQIGNNMNDSNLWKSEYDVPLERCKNIAGQIDFEFFADENGNLRFKPPTYNRTLPEHILDIESVESIYRGALDRFVGGKDSLELLIKLKMQSIAEEELTIQKNRIRELKNRGAKRLGSRITIDNKFKNIKRRISGGSIEQNPLSGTDNVDELVGTITSLRGYYDTINNLISDLVSKEDSINDKEGRELVEREKFTKIVDTHVDQLKIIVPQLRSDAEKTTTGSLSRLTDPDKIHRIQDSIIINSSINETSPEYTRLDIEGKMDFIENMPALYLNASGVDYDLWRNYGFQQQNIQAAFLHSGNQCVPYCQALLARQWAKIFSGSLTVRGDAKYKLSDTVYVEYLDMYFYISGVSHSFSYGGQYQTTLTLTYGRRVGYYIPYPFDVLGNIELEESFSSLINQDYRKCGGGWEKALGRPVIYEKGDYSPSDFGIKVR